ncbi:hypothetical protein PF006_g24971 [Phytophthora fragariae]|uniref:Cytochrome P450 n=2 Tax=Phytophthora fragariae TaxID=53985 RepID=A0A6A3R744_9STRA|nr:hypothetical protein PF006_g24971 [Phytophthora fragariae]
MRLQHLEVSTVSVAPFPRSHLSFSSIRHNRRNRHETPELFEDVLKTQDDVFLRGPSGQYISYDLFGNGMVITDGDLWFYHRKTASHLFSMQMMKDVMEATVRQKLDVFLDVLDT